MCREREDCNAIVFTGGTETSDISRADRPTFARKVLHDDRREDVTDVIAISSPREIRTRRKYHRNPITFTTAI